MDTHTREQSDLREFFDEIETARCVNFLSSRSKVKQQSHRSGC